MMEVRSVDPVSPDVLDAPTARRESSLMQSVNRNLRLRLETLAPTDAIAFFCECRSEACYSPVWLPVADFDALVARDAGWLLLDGHEPSALWHRREPLPTRTTARVLRAEAPPDPSDLVGEPSQLSRRGVIGLGARLPVRRAVRRGARLHGAGSVDDGQAMTVKQ
jgi:hypothetical protein